MSHGLGNIAVCITYKQQLLLLNLLKDKVLMSYRHVYLINKEFHTRKFIKLNIHHHILRSRRCLESSLEHQGLQYKGKGKDNPIAL